MSSLQPPDQGHPSSPSVIIDRDTFDQFFRQSFTRLCLKYQYKFGFDLDLTKEMVHTAFIKLWETRQQIHSAFALHAYLDRIITNNFLDIIKHEKVKMKYRHAVLHDELSNPATDDFLSADLKEMTAHINRAVEDLPEQMRKIFTMSRYEGLKYTKIAEELNISVKTVETQMGRALQKLRIKLAEYLISVIAVLSAMAKLFYIIFFKL